MGDPNPFEDASPTRAVVLTVRFLLELALLAGVAVVVLGLSAEWWRWPLALLTVVAVAAFWGLFISHKAKVKLPAPSVLALEAGLFIGVAAGLHLSGFVVAGIGDGHLNQAPAPFIEHLAQW